MSLIGPVRQALAHGCRPMVAREPSRTAANARSCRRPYGRALLVNTGSLALLRRRARWARRPPHAGSHTRTRCTPPSDDALANHDHSTGSLRSKPAPRASGAAPPTTASATTARPDPVIGQARSHSRCQRSCRCTVAPMMSSRTGRSPYGLSRAVEDVFYFANVRRQKPIWVCGNHPTLQHPSDQRFVLSPSSSSNT